MLLSQEQIQSLKANKKQITPELLAALRAHGNEGKQVALDILDTEKTDDGHYIDAFGNPISYNGDRGLKKAFTKMNLAEIHIHEIQQCVKDIHYFKDNYVKIVTPKGVNFPDLRTYQNDLLDTIADTNEEFPGQNESVVGLLSRQSGKSVTTAIYLTWLYNFKRDMNIGITANKVTLAREFLNNVKNILLHLPMWMVQGCKVWNISSISNESNMRILTDAPSDGAFRGFTCLGGDTKVTVDGEVTTLAELYRRCPLDA